MNRNFIVSGLLVAAMLLFLGPSPIHAQFTCSDASCARSQGCSGVCVSPSEPENYDPRSVYARVPWFTGCQHGEAWFRQTLPPIMLLANRVAISPDTYNNIWNTVLPYCQGLNDRMPHDSWISVSSPGYFGEGYYCQYWVPYPELIAAGGSAGSLGITQRKPSMTACGSRPCVVDGAQIVFTYSPQSPYGDQYWFTQLPYTYGGPCIDYPTALLHELLHVYGLMDADPDCGTVGVMYPRLDPYISRRAVTDAEKAWLSSVYNYAVCCPTLVTMGDLVANAHPDAVEVSWTAFPTGSAVFRVERSNQRNIGFRPVSPEMAYQGNHEFSYRDQTAVPGQTYYYRIAFREAAEWSYSGTVVVAAVGQRFRLQPITPNPSFGTLVRLRFQCAQPGHVSLDVYDPAGRLVGNVFRNSVQAGETVATWDRRDMSGRQIGAGVYFVRFSVNSRPISTQRLLLLR